MAEKAPATSATPLRETTEIEVPETMHIETTASPPQTDPETGAQKTDDVRAAIARNYEKNQRGKEIELGEIMRAEAEAIAREAGADLPEEPAAPSADAPTPAPEPVAAQPEAPLAPAPSPAPRTIKVDGREIAVTDEDLIRLAQLGLASHQRFQEAARLRQEAEALRQPPPNTDPQGTVQSPQAPAPAASTPLVDEATARDIARRMQYGSEEDQAKAIRDLTGIIAGKLQEGRPLGPTPEQVAQRATHDALATIRFEQNLAMIGNEFQEVFQDRGLTLLAADAVNGLRAHYDMLQQPQSDIQLYRQACQLVKDRYLKAPAPAAPPEAPKPVAQPAPPAAPPSDKLERKRAAPQPPASASQRAPMGSDAPRAPSASDIVNWMRKQRQQPTLN